MKVDSISNQAVQLGEKGIEGAVFFGRDCHRNSFEETIAIAVKFDLASFFLCRFENQGFSVPHKFVIVVARRRSCYE